MPFGWVYRNWLSKETLGSSPARACTFVWCATPAAVRAACSAGLFARAIFSASANVIVREAWAAGAVAADAPAWASATRPGAAMPAVAGVPDWAAARPRPATPMMMMNPNRSAVGMDDDS